MRKRTNLLLQACCAPCASAVLEKLSADYFLTLLYFNPNIQPAAEYKKRLQEFAKLKSKFNFALLVPEYNSAEWRTAVRPYAQEPEGGERCQVCFDYRLAYAASLAGSYDGFATTLSISPHKNLEQINRAGRSAAQKYKASFREFDFRNLYRRSVELSRELGLYRQKYCGCRRLCARAGR